MVDVLGLDHQESVVGDAVARVGDTVRTGARHGGHARAESQQRVEAAEDDQGGGEGDDGVVAVEADTSWRPSAVRGSAGVQPVGGVEGGVREAGVQDDDVLAESGAGQHEAAQECLEPGQLARVGDVHGEGDPALAGDGAAVVGGSAGTAGLVRLGVVISG